MPTLSPRPTGGRRPALAHAQRDLTPPAAVEAPVDLPDAQRATWDRLAPAAMRLRTLRPETVEGFRLLVRVLVDLDEAARILEADGLVRARTAHRLATHYRSLLQRSESLLSRFGLVAAGRPVEVPRDEVPPVNEFGLN